MARRIRAEWGLPLADWRHLRGAVAAREAAWTREGEEGQMDVQGGVVARGEGEVWVSGRFTVGFEVRRNVE